IKQFKLNEIFDSFVASSFVHFRKPDIDIYKIALDISQVMPQQVAYLDDRLMFVQVARALGINGIHHKSLISTKQQLSKLGLVL
ncbi:MAG TPA: HAD-IA family hydrolase, partial [Ignavibacteriaceae bacterium]|nr:HAD-IA family hydrolase [Ignavibacteriaceae bacterium]